MLSPSDGCKSEEQEMNSGQCGDLADSSSGAVGETNKDLVQEEEACCSPLNSYDYNYPEEPVVMLSPSDGCKSDEQDMNPGQCGDLADSSSGAIGENNKDPVQEEEACYSPLNSYDYNYPDCNREFSQMDDQVYNTSAGCGSDVGFQSDISHQSEVMPCNSEDLTNEVSKSLIHKITTVKSNDFNSATMMENQWKPLKTWVSSRKGSRSASKLSTAKSISKVGASYGSKSDQMNPRKCDSLGIFGVKDETNKDCGKKEACWPTINHYDYNYPDNIGNYSQLDDQVYKNTTSDDGSYANYGSKVSPCYSVDLPNVEDLAIETSKSMILKNALVNPESQFKPLKTWSKIGSHKSSLTAGKFKSFTRQNHVKVFQPAEKIPPSTRQTPVKSFQPTHKYSLPIINQNFDKGIQPAHKFPPWIGQNQGNFVQNGSLNYQPNHKAYNGNMNRNFNDIIRGPRNRNISNSPIVTSKDTIELTIERERYNLNDFQTDYPDAKFYVIKSFSEDDVYKSIKFEVWASTQIGNMKLNNAFIDMMEKSNQAGTTYPPAFLFFSVNSSGQFVGVAEMIGPVDFNKNMDFWQLDKWHGFFPVKWHIIKDVPNAKLRHIILQNNEDRDVTYTRDTQEIGLEQGIEMLKIFKNYKARTSLLDDVTFYEDRIKLVREKANSTKQESAYQESKTYQEYGEDFEGYEMEY